MAIQARRGNSSKFDPDKLLPGEPAVTLDTNYIYVSFEPGNTKRIASYEDMATLVAELNEEEFAKLSAAIDTAVSRANTISGTLETKLKNGDFRGAQGESGVATLTSGMFYLSVSDSVLL